MKLHRLALVLPLLAAASPARAQEAPTILETTTPRPWFATIQLGPALEVAGDWGTQLKFGQDVGYHLGGGTSGFALGLSLEESIGNCTSTDGVSCFSFQAGPKVWWNFQPFDDVGFFVGPAARLAFAHVVVSIDNPFGGGTSGSFTGVGLQLSLETRFVLSDRAILFFRPVTLDMIVGDSDDNLSFVYDDNFAMRYDVTFGGGLAF